MKSDLIATQRTGHHRTQHRTGEAKPRHPTTAECVARHTFFVASNTWASALEQLKHNVEQFITLEAREARSCQAIGLKTLALIFGTITPSTTATNGIVDLSAIRANAEISAYNTVSG
jgi:hypothetical protein